MFIICSQFLSGLFGVSQIVIECYREHLEGFKRYAELADAIEKWLEETGR